MFKKFLGISIVTFCLSANICANTNQETPTENFCMLETNHSELKSEESNQEEFTLFGVYNKTFYANVLEALESIKQHASDALDNLNDFEKKLKTEETIHQEKSEEKTISSPATIESFQTFLKKQEILDENILNLLSLLGFVAENQTNPENQQHHTVTENAVEN